MSLLQFTFEQQQHEIKAAADRERRRIRRAQMTLLERLSTPEALYVAIGIACAVATLVYAGWRRR